MNKFLSLLFFLLTLSCFSQSNKLVITDDISNFWTAYDLIIQEKDSTKQIDLINNLYIKKGTPGLVGIMQARRYTDKGYIYAINNYPKFWNSIRANTLTANSYAKKLEKGIKKLKKIYPEAKPAKIYFSIGVLKTSGTTKEDKVLIGAEVAMADSTIITGEIKKDYPHLISYFKTNPINNLDFLNVHEYIHTQQKSTIGNYLLSQAMMEGVAEFVAEIAMKTKSPNPQIEFGYKNEEKIKQEFTKEMFSTNFNNWFWNSPENQFGMRDLGYFVGYAIVKKYYDNSIDKKLATKELIELDYNNEADLVKLVNKASYFEKPVNDYKIDFENNRPIVTKIEQFDNGNLAVNPTIKIVTLYFSHPMDINSRGFEYGPLGESNLMRVKKVIGYSADKKSFSFEVSLEPNKQYQLLVTNFFDDKGFALKPYLIDFKTSK
ncbi:hypothetical protein [Algoriella sp.]|uniref:hypothetical protein n=1 Tax=Algoriella sp. TaxID=1872434 RepID=UPI001B1B9C98|nr:hypothetical protein [Algoriella sp.]MBO6212789.1 hypothetical protein [Algoriella sp.]